MRRILVLAGTTEARIVSQTLAQRGDHVTLALKGLTRTPGVPTGVHLRSGGFGGPSGLAAYLKGQKIDLMIDATHPFAAGMSKNAHWAAKESGIPLIAIQRPPWIPRPGDRWQVLQSLPKAVDRLRQAAPQSVLLALGGQGAESFRMCPQHRFQARVLSNSNTALATSSANRWRRLEIRRISKAPTIAQEMQSMRDFRADLMIVRNAGGILSAKLTAARRLRLPVWVIARPAMPPVLTYPSPSALLHHLDHGMPHS